MERLTREELFMGAASYNCRGHEKDCDLNCPNKDSCGWLKDALEKLKQYEDLEERLCAVYGECDGMLEMVIEHLERHENADIPEPVFKARLLTDGNVDRWEEYKTLEEQGKLLKLPCMVGDTVWELCKCDDGIYRIFPMKVTKVVPYGSIRWIKGKEPAIWNVYAISDYTDMYKSFYDFGKTVFLMQEEAEAALKKMEESK